MTDIYCYYHRYARLEIIQRYGQNYAVCPECRHIIADHHSGDIWLAFKGEYVCSDELLHRVINSSEPVKPAKRNTGNYPAHDYDS